jgi:uncharacterized membrane protein
VTLLVLFLVKSGQKQCDHSDLQRHNLAACLGGLFLVTAVLIIITVAWGALHKHQSVHALVAAING